MRTLAVHDMLARIVQTIVERQFFKIHTHRFSREGRIFRAPSNKVQLTVLHVTAYSEGEGGGEG